MRDILATLATSLIEGMLEEPPWQTFLDDLVSATNADVATLAFHPPGWEHADGLILASSGVPPDRIRASQREFNYPDNEVARVRMDEGVSYSFADLLDWDNHDHADFFEGRIRSIGITDARQMRVREKGGVDAWLAVVRMGGQFTPDVDDCLRTIAPMLRGVLGNYVGREHDRFAVNMAEDTARRLQFGWIALDANGVIVGADRFGDNVLESSGTLFRAKTGRLEVRPPELQNEVQRALGKLLSGKAVVPRAIPLCADPWLDMLLIRARYKPLAATGAAEVIAYVHGDNWSSIDRQAQLSDLFSLSPKQAGLALALCRGRTIAEAAAEIGVTLETARSYSKATYAKIGARGQPDLVRIIMGSILALSPDV